MQFKNILITIVSLILFSASSMGFALEARVDRTTLPENETLQLEVSGSFSAFNMNIDLSPLEKDFRVLDNRRSTNMQYINGDFSAQTTLTVTLEPKETGIFEIPALTVEGETSQPIQIKVTQADVKQSNDPNEGGPIAIEVELDQTDTWVQAQLLLNVKLYQSVKLYNAELNGIKELQEMGISIEKIGDNKSYQSKRNNQTYQVTELNYRLSSDNPGKIELPTFSFQGQMPARGYGSRYGKAIRATAKPIVINVQDIPKNYPSATWIPATRLDLSDDLNDVVEVPVGESINRNLIASVHGQEAAVIPDYPEINSPLVSIYSDTPELNNQLNQDGVTGVRMDNIALITKAPGTLKLPELRITWFNTTTGQVEHTSLPPRTIKIMGAPGTGLPTPPPVQQPPLEATTPESQQAPSTTPVPVTESSTPVWIIVLLVILVIMVILQMFFIAALYQRKDRAEQETETKEETTAHFNWKEELPKDFIACHRIIERELQAAGLTSQDLTDELTNLINKFRASCYSPDTSKQFSAEDRKTLRDKLAVFFSSHKGKQTDAPSLYPN